MFLCDIGNTNAKLNHNGKIWSLPIFEFENFKAKEKIFYINVNTSLSKKLALDKNFVDLEPYFHFDTAYKGMGVDRISACYGVSDGVIVDAGSAITIDIVSNKIHLGGFILPGIYDYLNTYKNISSKLDIALNSSIILDALPQNTTDAVSYGIIKSIILTIKENCKNKKIYFTGGDGKFLSRFFEQSIYKKDMVFDGMRTAIIENNLN